MAGPVVAAAVVLPIGCKPIPGLNDSKVLSALQRDELVPLIRRAAVAVAVAAASVHEIDRYNIRRASIMAMQRALDRLGVRPDHILVDGLPIPELGWEHEAIVDGDARCSSIAAASVIAKTVRDRMMTKLAARYPEYGWDRNSGYATKEHRDAIRAHGLTPHHRRGWQAIQVLLAGDQLGLFDEPDDAAVDPALPDTLDVDAFELDAVAAPVA